VFLLGEKIKRNFSETKIRDILKKYCKKGQWITMNQIPNNEFEECYEILLATLNGRRLFKYDGPNNNQGRAFVFFKRTEQN